MEQSLGGMTEIRDPLVAEIFQTQGPLSALLDGFAPRDGQSKMAQAVANALHARDVLVCEAGTGIGKTLAYLVPALLSGGRCIVATGTRNLQDQLFYKDLPLAIEAVDAHIKTALLKGRSNYVCRHRLERYWQEGQFDDRAVAADLGKIREFTSRTFDGDIAAAVAVPEKSPAWMYATSTTDNCLGSECDHFDDCFVFKARAQALGADLVVVNHHLLAADLALKEDGFGELLPAIDAVIVDEAHDFAEAATPFFGETLSSRQAFDLVRDTVVADNLEAGDVPELKESIRGFEQSVRDFRLAFGVQPRRLTYLECKKWESVAHCLDGLIRHTGSLTEQLKSVSERGKDLAGCLRRALEFKSRLRKLADNEDSDFVSWIDLSKKGFVWYLSPLDLGRQFGSKVNTGDAAWIFTSATLAVNGRVEHFTDRLGLAHFASHAFDSPFDYARHCLCYLPLDLPDPGHVEHLPALMTAIRPVLSASRGRAFLLFTSHRALQRAEEELRTWGEYSLFVQGSMPRDQLLERFRRREGGVLLGTSSFWQGVDVRGEALSVVVIDKLPFAVPDDPMLKARATRLREQGQEPFSVMQIPGAVISLKQGVGRLIRDPDDTGVLVLGDPRLISRGYGRIFLHSLPPMRRSRDIEDVRAFFRHHDLHALDERSAG